MDLVSLGLMAIVVLVSIGATFLVTQNQANKKIGQFKSLNEAVSAAAVQKQQAENDLKAVIKRVTVTQEIFNQLDTNTKDLQMLQKNAHQISEQLIKDQAALVELDTMMAERQASVENSELSLHELMAKIDLYSRLDEFVDYGHFEMPEYLYETGERFAAEIKIIRDRQKLMIQSGGAISQTGNVRITGDSSLDKKIIDGQMKLILRAFNIECDLLIANVSPSNFDRTLGRIEKLANDLEKLVASLRCGIHIDYVTAKYEECGIQYQYTLKKKDELEEQKLIREQMREEARAEKEYRDAVEAAEKEERLYRSLLDKARTELVFASSEERALAEAKIAELERRLAEAEAKEQRAKSLAEQTRRGHVYVISNVGSFGEHVYKIGMTRRLDPMDRVKELGDASVPFSFDIHAIIFTEDAPAMETALHRKFSHYRVNAVNLRKEFFRVELDKIRDVVYEIGGDEVDFKTTIVAEEFFETKRLREVPMPIQVQAG
jgi:hypothetical protein